MDSMSDNQGASSRGSVGISEVTDGIPETIVLKNGSVSVDGQIFAGEPPLLDPEFFFDVPCYEEYPQAHPVLEHIAALRMLSSQDRPPEFADFDDGERLPLRLYEELDPGQEGLKTYPAKVDAPLMYDTGHGSDYSIMVERLLSVDGWETTSGDGKTRTQPMTLIVFKLAVKCTSLNGRVKSIKATVEFENQKTGRQADPEVEAWAPFRELQPTNPTLVNIKRTDNKDTHAGTATQADPEVEAGTLFHKLELTNPVEPWTPFHTLQPTNPTLVDVKRTDDKDARAGPAKESITGSGGWKRDSEISFERRYWDRAYAYAEMDNTTGKRGGVTWVMEQSEMQNNGVLPEIFTAVLLKRESAEAPYVVNFRIRVQGGSVYGFTNQIKRVFNLGPVSTKPFLVRPATEAKVRYEGNLFLGCVNADNLGSLRAKDSVTGLTIVSGAGSAHVETAQGGRGGDRDPGKDTSEDDGGEADQGGGGRQSDTDGGVGG